MIGWARTIALCCAAVLACSAWATHGQAEPVPTERGPFVRVLGTVQDGGLPHAACEHAGCRLVREGRAPKRFISSLALVLPETRQVYLFDATPDLREQLDALRDVRTLPIDRVDRAPVDGVFLTHAHIGHYLGLAFFGFEAVHTTALPVWATPRMSRFLSTNGPWSQLVETGNIALRPLPLDRAVELAAGVSVAAFAVPHRDELSDTVGFRIEGPNRSLIFVPDTDKWATWEPSLLERLTGVDVALLDGSFFSADELPGRDVTQIGHPMIGRTMGLLQERVTAGSLEAFFIHLNHSNPALLADSAERREIEARGFAVAQEGQEFGL
ncbi:MAG: MBL fold metallo-hydrolase [Acidobacteria bacterium]|nr:MBL fold metallo-hydrolase [Acidobacteriota bacterium]